MGLRVVLQFVVLAGLYIGCSGSPTSVTVGDVARGDASSDLDGSVGNQQFTAAEDAGGPLQVHIQVNGGGNVCGACDVVLAQVQGGQQPYTYTWSDSTWKGAGPFTLCPTAAMPVSVTVTDSGGQGVGEGMGAKQTAKAATTIACTSSDGGSSEPGALNGCVATSMSGTPDAGTNDAGSIECTANEVEAGVAWADGGVVASEASPLGYTFLAGHTYQASYDQLLPIELGQAVTVDIYGSTTPNVCQADQLLFTLTLNGSIFNWHQQFCFTPTQNYTYTVTDVYIQGVLFYFNPLSVATICDTCSM
jgi:hypothetical protein